MHNKGDRHDPTLECPCQNPYVFCSVEIKHKMPHSRIKVSTWIFESTIHLAFRYDNHVRKWCSRYVGIQGQNQLTIPWI